MNSHAKWLRQAAKEIAAEGHNGWGNTCTQAADEIDRLSAQTRRSQIIDEMQETAQAMNEAGTMSDEALEEINLVARPSGAGMTSECLPACKSVKSGQSKASVKMSHSDTKLAPSSDGSHQSSDDRCPKCGGSGWVDGHNCECALVAESADSIQCEHPPESVTGAVNEKFCRLCSTYIDPAEQGLDK